MAVYLEYCIISGNTLDLQIGSGVEVKVFSVQYDTASVSGTLTKLDGDREETDIGSGTQNRLAVWDASNKLKDLTGLYYDPSLDTVTFEGTTIYSDQGETNWSRGFVDLRRISDAYNAFLTFWRGRLTGGVKSGDVLGRMSAYGYDGSAWSSGSRARINFVANGDWSSTSHGTGIEFQITSPGSTTVQTAALLTSQGLDFKKLRAIAMACDSGSSFPSSPATGQWFLLTSGSYPILYIYDGTVWQKILDLNPAVQRGQFPTLIEHSLTLRDHFTSSSMSSYWTEWENAPAGSIYYDWYSHILRMSASTAQVGVTCFLYKTITAATNADIEGLVATDSNYAETGIRLDDGSDNHFAEVYVKGGVGTYNNVDAAVYSRSRDNGGTITTTQRSSEFFGGQLVQMQINSSLVYGSSGTLYVYVDMGFVPNFSFSLSLPSKLSFTRIGIFHRNLTSSGNRVGYCHFFASNKA
jgi:hypothetical protein